MKTTRWQDLKRENLTPEQIARVDAEVKEELVEMGRQDEREVVRTYWQIRFTSSMAGSWAFGVYGSKADARAQLSRSATDARIIKVTRYRFVRRNSPAPEPIEGKPCPDGSSEDSSPASTPRSST